MNQYKLAMERERWIRLQEDRRRQELLVNSYRSRLSAGTTDSNLDQNLLSILTEPQLNSSRAAAVRRGAAVQPSSGASTSTSSSASKMIAGLASRHQEQQQESIDITPSPTNIPSSSAATADKEQQK